MEYKVISINLIGSNLYNLAGKNSDLDYLVIYHRKPEDYLTINPYQDFMPDEKLKGKVPVNYRYWDILKFLRLASRSSWGAFEALYCLNAYHDKPVYKYLLSQVKRDNFSQRELLYHARGVINSNHHRGYMKAFHYLFMQYVLQENAYPEDLDAWRLLDSVNLDASTKQHILELFVKKQEGYKDLPFVFDRVDDSLFKDFPKLDNVDYTDVLRKCIFGF